MLSGIAHDPIQRDIFTPLFLGAQLPVPSKANIAHERLAEWFKDQKPTVTHLTPAMGQILVGGATAEFPSLQNAFFVGDVLTKRDCQSLQRLAINVKIIDIMGSTESQRSVCFYEVPSRADDPNFLETLKDDIPAERECTTYKCLSLIAKIRDCKTFVRRDKNEEPTLAQGLEDVEDEGTDIRATKVFFKRFRRMQTEVQDHLKGRLPSYAVPTIYIVLDKLPLNPNGKVEKPNLPFPDIVEQTEDASDEDSKRWESMTEMKRTIVGHWADLIPGINAQTITPQNDFFDLGGHSMLAQQMLVVVRKVIGANVSISTLYENPSLAGFSVQVDKQPSAANSDVTQQEKKKKKKKNKKEKKRKAADWAHQGVIDVLHGA